MSRRSKVVAAVFEVLEALVTLAGIAIVGTFLAAVECGLLKFVAWCVA